MEKCLFIKEFGIKKDVGEFKAKWWKFWTDEEVLLFL